MTAEHPTVQKIIDAKAGLLHPEQAEPIVEHFWECDLCFVNVARYVDEHYQEAKEYLAFGFQEDLEKIKQPPTEIPESLKQRIEELAPPVYEKVAKLQKALRGLGLLSQKQQSQLIGLASMLCDLPQRCDRNDVFRAWELLTKALEGLKGTWDASRQRYERALMRCPNAAKVIRREFEQAHPGPVWPWRSVMAALLGRVTRMPSLQRQKQHLLGLEKAGILVRIVTQQFRSMAREEAPHFQLLPYVDDLLSFCAGAISKCIELENAEHVRDKLKEAFAESDAALDCEFRMVRGKKLSLYPPIAPPSRKAQQDTARASRFDWGGFVFPGHKYVLPDMVGMIRTRDKVLRFMVEVKREIRSSDVNVAKAIMDLKKAEIDGAILISRVPLSRIRRELEGIKLDRSVPEGGRVLLVEWDEALDKFTDFYPGNSVASVIGP